MAETKRGAAENAEDFAEKKRTPGVTSEGLHKVSQLGAFLRVLSVLRVSMKSI